MDEHGIPKLNINDDEAAERWRLMQVEAVIHALKSGDTLWMDEDCKVVPFDTVEWKRETSNIRRATDEERESIRQAMRKSGYDI